MIQVEWQRRSEINNLDSLVVGSVRGLVSVALERLKEGHLAGIDSREVYLLAPDVGRMYALVQIKHALGPTVTIQGIQLAYGKATGHLVGLTLPADPVKLTAKNLWHLRGVEPADINRLADELQTAEHISSNAYQVAVTPLLKARQFPRLLHRRR